MELAMSSEERARALRLWDGEDWDVEQLKEQAERRGRRADSSGQQKRVREGRSLVEIVQGMSPEQRRQRTQEIGVSTQTMSSYKQWRRGAREQLSLFGALLVVVVLSACCSVGDSAELLPRDCEEDPERCESTWDPWAEGE